MSDTTTITPEERAELRRILSMGTSSVDGCGLFYREAPRLLNALEQAEARAEKAEDEKTALEEDMEATEKSLKEYSGFFEELCARLKERFPKQYADLEGDEEKGRIRVLRTDLVPDGRALDVVEKLFDESGFALAGLGFQQDVRFAGAAAAQQFVDDPFPEKKLGGIDLGREEFVGPDLHGVPSQAAGASYWRSPDAANRILTCLRIGKRGDASP